MAKNEPGKKSEKNFLNSFLGFFKRMGLGIHTAFKNMISELKKVTWPTRKELINYTLVVLAFMAGMGVIIGLLDAGAGMLTNWLISG